MMSNTQQNNLTDVAFTATADNSTQHMLFYDSGMGKKKPLLVALHTWSNGYLTDKSVEEYQRWCEATDWALAFPDFRGANISPDAMGSAKAVADIADAVEHAKTLCAVDDTRIYLAGVSGGGHMALLAAALLPEIWAGVTAWVPIFDLADWWRQCSANTKYTRYTQMIEACAGGAPLPRTQALEECRLRSASACLAGPVPFMLDINGGLFDGRDGSVPFTHSLKAFNASAKPEDKIPETGITTFYETQESPSSPAAQDELYGEHQPVFRKTSGNTRVTIFNGGHGIIYNAALNLLAKQQKGTPACWPEGTAAQSAHYQAAGL
jgi:pimeloyl-ACP methyl ester carboxylesterase